MRILFLGDVMGRSGREAVYNHLPGLRERLSLAAKPSLLMCQIFEKN